MYIHAELNIPYGLSSVIKQLYAMFFIVLYVYLISKLLGKYLLQ